MADSRFWTDGRAVVKMYRGDERPHTSEGTDDSDCESIPEPINASSPETQVDEKEENEPESIPVLTMGSFAAYAQNLRQGSCFDFFDSWRSLFFYMCTDVIQFARLKSQGVSVRARRIEEQMTPDKPPPCSPKVIYSLAAAVSRDVHTYCGHEDTQYSTFSLRLRLFVIWHSTIYNRRSPP